MSIGSDTRPRHYFVMIALLCLGVTAFAQDDPFDPLGDDMHGEANEHRLIWSGDVVLRGDHVSGLPGGRQDLERVRARARLGLTWWLGDRLEIGGAIEASQGSDDNIDNRRNNDNERSDAWTLDRLFVRWRLGEHARVTLGKDALPLTLSPLLWDEDLRPAGASVEHDLPMGEFDRLSLAAGYWAGQHLYGDDSRIAAAQVGWHLREGARLGGSILLGLIDFDRLETLTRQGLARQNRIAGGQLVSDYRLIDLQFIGRARLGDLPLRVGVDLARNLGADDKRDADRLDVRLGDDGRARGWEIGYAVQRIQRDAAMAAFNDDDWWFHADARGHLLWFGYGLSDRWRLRLSGLRETRDSLPHTTDRILLDLHVNW